jgi:hypothetical protein
MALVASQFLSSATHCGRELEDRYGHTFPVGYICCRASSAVRVGGPDSPLVAAATPSIQLTKAVSLILNLLQCEFQLIGEAVPRLGHMQKDRAILARPDVLSESPALGRVMAIGVDSLHFSSFWSASRQQAPR